VISEHEGCCDRPPSPVSKEALRFFQPALGYEDAGLASSLDGEIGIRDPAAAQLSPQILAAALPGEQRLADLPGAAQNPLRPSALESQARAVGPGDDVVAPAEPPIDRRPPRYGRRLTAAGMPAPTRDTGTACLARLVPGGNSKSATAYAAAPDPPAPRTALSSTPSGLPDGPSVATPRSNFP
jgi:hypothetical protein